MERRDFLRQASVACIGTVCGGMGALLSGCASTPRLELPVEGRSIQIPLDSLTPGRPIIVTPRGELFDLAVVASGTGGYTVLQLRCTHADNRVALRGEAFECPLHGSRFGTDGGVVRGPASRPLERLQAAPAGKMLIVALPE
jgi:Rieske Fe-S protein